MAKKQSFDTGGGSGSLFDLINKIDKGAEILADSKTAVIKDYINTGSYILNAAMTGSLFKGIPTGRVVTLAGDPGTGKSYLALSVCREAQKKGYIPIYMDSEGSIDVDFVTRLGCDPKNFVIKQVQTISEVSTFVANICMKEKELPVEDRHKIILVLDSLGNLTSDKEFGNIVAGGGARDMTKQQEIKALFRANATMLAQLGIPFIVNAHIYQTQEMFSKTIVSGGSGINYNSSITMLLSTAKLEDKASEKAAEKKKGDFTKKGVLVSAKASKNRFTIPQIVRFQIPFFHAPNPYVGLENYITWENSGIIRGQMLSEKDYNKMSDADKQKCYEMTDTDGNVAYAYPKDTATKIVVKHLHGTVQLNELWSPDVFTPEILKNLDEVIIRPNFELPSQSSNADLDELIEAENE